MVLVDKLIFFVLISFVYSNTSPEEEQGVKYANKCEGTFQICILRLPMLIKLFSSV